MEIKTWGELTGTDPKSSHCVLKTVKNFKSKQCLMSRVATNRGRQRFRVAVNGESLSDEKTARVGTQESVKKNSQGRNPRIREEKALSTAGKRAVPTASKDVNL